MKLSPEFQRAHDYATDHDWIWEWQDDPDCTEDDFEFEEDKAHVRAHGAVGCILYRPCTCGRCSHTHRDILGSLWGITESLNNAERDAYRREVEAELALEALSEIEDGTRPEVTV